MSGPGVCEHVAASDPGRRRASNQDAVLDRPPLFAVADGVGGGPAGELASSIAISTLAEAAPAELPGALRAAHSRIRERAERDPESAGMATTMTAALAGPDGVTLAHVGDSRAYRLRDGKLEQLTDDHAFAAELVRTGALDAEAAAHHPQRSMITRSLGGDREPEIDVLELDARAGDLFLLCSDGLSEMVTADELREALSYAGSLPEAADALVRAANRHGGRDNISLVGFRLG